MDTSYTAISVSEAHNQVASYEVYGPPVDIAIHTQPMSPVAGAEMMEKEAGLAIPNQEAYGNFSLAAEMGRSCHTIPQRECRWQLLLKFGKQSIQFDVLGEDEKFPSPAEDQIGYGCIGDGSVNACPGTTAIWEW